MEDMCFSAYETSIQFERSFLNLRTRRTSFLRFNFSALLLLRENVKMSVKES